MISHADAGNPTPILQIEAVGLRISGIHILSDIDLIVREGECLAVIGPNGAGKTSLINVLNGMTRPTSGAVILKRRDITTWRPDRRAHAGMARTFQTSNLLLGRTVEENVRLAAAARSVSWRSLLTTVRKNDVTYRKAGEALELVGLARQRTTLAGSLSHGDRRKLEVAVVLAQDAEVILLDEPMAGVNAEDVEGLVALIRRIRAEQKRTIVMVEHHLNVVLDLADRIAVLHHGKLLAVDIPPAIVANDVVQRAYVGEAL